MSSVFDTGRRARTEPAEEPAPSASQEIRLEVRRVLRRWRRWVFAAIASIPISAGGGGYAYWKDQQAAAEQLAVERAVDRQRLLTVERDQADIRAQLTALFPFLLNPPARPPASTGD